MKVSSAIASICFLVPAATARINNGGGNNDEIHIESFDNPVREWRELNDPVMGGESTGTFTVNKEDGVGVFNGEVVDVPFLKAPGFIQAVTYSGPFPDVSSCTSFKLLVKSTVSYEGYRFGFGTKHAADGHHAFGFKANMKVNNDGVLSSSFGEVIIPFDEFSYNWDDATGDQKVSCKEDQTYCPDEAALQDLKTISIWAEGVRGKIHLEIKFISAIGCSSSSAASV